MYPRPRFPLGFSSLHTAIAPRLRSDRGPSKYRCRLRTRTDCADRESSRSAQLAAEALSILLVVAELAEGIPVQSRSPASLAWPSLAGQHVESKWYSWLWSGLRLRAVVDHLSKSRTSCQNRAINLQSRTYAKDITERHHTIQ